MRVVVGMTLRVDVPVAMIVGVRDAGPGLYVGAALGIERGVERDDPRSQTPGHRLDDGIAADAQPLRQYFGWQMAVAKVPGEPRQRQGIGRSDLGQRFRLGDDLDGSSVLKPQPVAAAQHCRLGEVE